ncbi:hypothetical protein KGF56_001236 [Candida oxycetoniae]|uniref:Uncharacterized protein n=1 Tax=Candida oxycetoniae TaxID=497107 RepID=A0AAI9T072_9ASCO|nr:uncharacterized protein KGF56_001236 [Candida oxycetoniae]KAI3406017.2 hypothetical protein KGF56_001236 [Candida oxycetoniae]
MLQQRKWTDISTELIKDPDNFELWQRLIESAEYNDKQGITKSTPQFQLDILRVSYDKFLNKYPFLYKYWVRLAEWEFKLCGCEKAIKVYKNAFQHLRFCIELWYSYLQFRVNTISNNIDQVLGLFEEARRLIGTHFYSYEFYNLYLTFLENYATEENQFMRKYYILLRIIIEIPLYHYEFFYKKYFKIIQQIADPKELTKEIGYIVPEKDSLKDRKKLSAQLKKTFIDAYITTQFKVYELYQFERKIHKHYCDVALIPRQELDSWEEYFDFLELKNYPRSYIEMNLHRYLYITANYPQSWIKAADFYIYHELYNSTRQVLIRGWKYLGDYKILIKLIDLEIFLKQFHRARDLILNYLKYSITIPIPVYEKLLNIEYIFHQDVDHLLASLKEIILETQNDWFFTVLTNYTIDRQKKIKFLKEMKEFSGREFYEKALKALS